MAWYIDRSRIQAYQDCKRLRFLNYHWRGRGLERRALGLPLLNGQQLHQGLAALLCGESIDATITTIGTTYRNIVHTRGIHLEDPTAVDFLVAEQLALLEGLLRAWAAVRFPALCAEYDVVAIEKEQPWTITPGLIDMVRCDALVRRKSDGVLFILEFKSVATASEGWIESWQHNSQLLANTRAVETLYQEPVGGILIEGIVKGRRAMDKGAMSPFKGLITQQSPLCYGYRQREKVTNSYIYDTSWSAKAEKFAVWEQMPITQWLAFHLTEADKAALFVQIPPLRPTNRDLQRWERQTIAQERMVEADVAEVLAVQQFQDDDIDRDALDNVLDEHFPQNHNHCFRYFGHPCAFEKLCFNPQVAEDPLGSGLYQVRIPHHPTEVQDDHTT